MPGAVNVQSSPLASLQQPGVPPFALPGPPGGFGFTPRWADPKTFQTSNIQQPLVPENLTTPVTYEWNLNAQYEFIRNWVLELGYVGSHGIHQEQGGAVYNAINWNPGLLASTTNPINGITTNTAKNVNLRSLYPGISTTSNMFATSGVYKYNAFLATLRRQLANGLQLQVAYTWDKGLITQSYGINTPPYVTLQLAPSPGYHPQRVVINYVWNLPVHLTGFRGRILNDWTWAGVTTIQNGVPFTVYDSNSGSVFFQGGAPGNTYGPALLCPGGPSPLTSGSIQSRLNDFLNSAAFCPPKVLGDDGSATGFGNTSLGAYLSPGQNNWDMSIAKLIKIRENKTLEMRGEFFNTFNHPQFSFNPVDDPAFAAQDVSGNSFGQISVASVNPRLVQLVLKFLF